MRSVDRYSKTRVLTERRGPWDAEEIAVELYGGGEGWKDTVKRRNVEEGSRTAIPLGHHSFDCTVVGDTRVAELHEFRHNLDAISPT